MGGAVSSFSGNQSEADKTKILLNVILRDMFQRADLVDLYSLADPSRCSKYIVVGADAIEQLFSKLNLEPRMGKKGEIYFQKISTLEKANPLGDERRNQICSYLSFFFVRIFQIYGALTLSVVDSEYPSTEPFVQLKDVPRDRRGVIEIKVPQLRGFEQRPVSWMGFGGALTRGDLLALGAAPAAGVVYGSGTFYLDPLLAHDYKILNKYLIIPSDGLNSERPMVFDNYRSMEILQSTLYDFPGLPPAGAPAAAGAPTRGAARRCKDFGVAGESPLIRYSFQGKDGNPRTLAARLLIEKEGNTTNVELNNLTLMGSPAPPRPIIIKGVLRSSTDNEDDLPVSSPGSKQLNAYLVELFIQGYEKIVPPVFSPIEFLHKYSIIKSTTEDRVRIGDTKAILVNLTRIPRGEPLPITYADKYGKDSVEITTSINILRDETISTKGRRYRIIISLRENDLDTRPHELLKLLNKKDSQGRVQSERYRDFYIREPASDKDQPLSSAGETIPVFISSIFDRLLKGEKDNLSESDISYDSKGRPIPYDNVPDEYKVKSLWTALVKDPPLKSHCIARAVQLLNVAAVRDPRSGNPYSSVCRINFPYIKDGSLPKPEGKITTSAGIKAMAMLFADTVSDKFIPQIRDTLPFQNFRKRMDKIFRKDPDAAERDVAKIDDIIDKAYPFCKVGEPDTHDKDKITLPPNNNVINSLQNRVRTLIKRQTDHMARVMQLMFRLFDEKSVRSGSIKISDQVLSGGMKAVNDIGEQARQLLIEYYSDCEKTYTEGIWELHRALGEPVPPARFVKVD